MEVTTVRSHNKPDKIASQSARCCRQAQPASNSDLASQSLAKRNAALFKTGFVPSIYKMIETEAKSDSPCVVWSVTKDSFIVRNCEHFAQLLPRYYKTTNYTSFVRQLNMYGFKKLKLGRGVGEFIHPNFSQGNLEEIKLIKRRQVIKSSAKANASVSSEDIKALKHKVNSLKHNVRNARQELKTLQDNKTLNQNILFNLKSFTLKNHSEVMAFFLLLTKHYDPALMNRVTDSAFQAGMFSTDDTKKLFPSANSSRFAENFCQSVFKDSNFIEDIIDRMSNNDVTIPMVSVTSPINSGRSCNLKADCSQTGLTNVPSNASFGTPSNDDDDDLISFHSLKRNFFEDFLEVDKHAKVGRKYKIRKSLLNGGKKRCSTRPTGMVHFRWTASPSGYLDTGLNYNRTI